MAVKTRRYSARDVTILVIGLGVAIAVNVSVIWGPTLASIGLSGTGWNGIGPIEWIGGQNYHDLAAEYPPFWSAVRNNVLWLGFLGLVATPFGLFCAVLLDRRLRMSRFYQSALYMPVVLSLAVVGFIAQLVYSSDYGVLNAVTGLNVDWLGDRAINIWVVMIAAGWRHVGYVMIIYLAGLKAVDPALKEAAAIDGANERQAFFRVVFPTLRPVNVIVLVITVIEALRAFDIVYAINKGRNGLELLSVLVTENIVGEASRIGFGSAIAVILLVISMGFIVAYLSQMFREER
ncbi:N-Acetyl-D-glucosamine ABC transport system, permease protein 1 [[Actinomadura] parvosata subsp. kistnae]|uniref:ABC transporter permease n=1 Tax=[Actinomadura] parvosata subsp. kistnae TaxID=1909395 RepID=A0A1V0A3X8_9ACTN|nr:sugar ABC transporter permease [Nonomuraea sp. ATCC 55076]AQZ64925.1 ABC transporter permease [Nonomuraea sp. ATCC 55076]SPL96153.1 N-Acetyl-D-glucosamine ABC transport system, permease protein 1 [Actinomadura parvosata subsp. kistnae]